MQNKKCICDIKPLEKNGYLGYGNDIIDNSTNLAYGLWTTLNLGIQHDGKYVLWACGEDRAEYFPKYCPECGRRLNAE